MKNTTKLDEKNEDHKWKYGGSWSIQKNRKIFISCKKKKKHMCPGHEDPNLAPHNYTILNIYWLLECVSTNWPNNLFSRYSVIDLYKAEPVPIYNARGDIYVTERIHDCIML